jgi:hypothetical protein
MADEKNEAKDKDFTTTTYAECRTGGGQPIEIKCRPKDVELAKKYAMIFHSIHIPETSELGVDHGCYGRYTRFIIKQHKYAGGGWPGCGGFIEVLEIKNPPEGQHGIVIHKEDSDRSTFYEFESLDEALKAWEKSFSFPEELIKEKGFIRRVDCGLLEPWFYAVGNQAINGDFAFPDYLNHNHPAYRTGRKVKLVRYDGEEKIKTCWGTTMRKHKGYMDTKETKHLVIQFDDGTTWSEYGGTETILPLNEEDLLKEKILDTVRKLLNGKKDKVVVISEGRRLTIESVETNRSIGYYFTSGIQQMIDEAEKQKDEITFVIQSKDKTIIGGEEFLITEKDIEDPLVVRGDDYEEE